MDAPVLFLVRSQVPAEERADFDHWYETDHMPLAADVLGAGRRWRYWSHVDPSIHYAIYEFATVEQLTAALATPGNEELIREYDARWGNRVQRTRDIIVNARRRPPDA